MNKRLRMKTIAFLSSSTHFSDSIISILTHKSTQILSLFIQNNASSNLLLSLSKDFTFLPLSHHMHSRFSSLILNLKAHSQLKEGNEENALTFVDQALQIDERYKLHYGQYARTLLHKGLITRKIYMKEKNLYHEETTVQLVQKSLQMMRKFLSANKKSSKDKLSEILIMFLHCIVLEFPSSPKEKQLNLLYHSAFKMSQQILGPKHDLTGILKKKGGDVQKFIVRKKRIHTQQKKRQQTIEKPERLKTSIIICTKKAKSAMATYEEKNRLSQPKNKNISNFDDAILYGLKQNKKQGCSLI